MPPALSANHVSAARLKAALLSSVSSPFRHPCKPPSPHPPPDLHPEARFESPKSDPLSSYLQGLSSSITSHQCLDSIWGFSIPRTASSPPLNITSSCWSLTAKEFIILFCTHGNKSSCSQKKLRVSPD